MSSPSPKTRRRDGSIWSLELHIVGGTRNKLFYQAVCSLRRLSDKIIEAHTKRGVGYLGNASEYGTQPPEVGIRIQMTDTASVTVEDC